MAFKDWGGMEKVLINLEGHGRQGILDNIDISRTVGWFTGQFPVVLEMGTAHPGDLPGVIQQVKEILGRIPKRGIGYGILKYLTPEEKKAGVTFDREPEINFNYLGQYDGKSSSDIFRTSEMKKGDKMDAEFEKKYVIDINGIILEDELIFTFSYNRKEYKRSTVERLAACYKAGLLRIIDHGTGFMKSRG